MARGNKDGTVLDLIVICEKKGTIKYSNKIDKFCQIAELCKFEVKKTWPFSSVEKLNFCVFAIQDEVTGEKSSNLRGNYSRQTGLPKYSMLISFALS